MFLFFSCLGASKAGPVPVYPPPLAAETPSFEVVEHQYSTLGKDVPDWIFQYLNAGIPGVEALSRFADSYTFIDENSGTNIKALNQWSEGFVPAQDFSRLVSMRVQTRFIGPAGGVPDLDYGRYFEAAVRAVSDGSYGGAQVEGKFWIIRGPVRDSERGRSQRIYDYFILVSIKKDELKTQLNRVLFNAAEGLTLSREQNTAINRLRDAFYDTF
jgi:hypothetical protein